MVVAAVAARHLGGEVERGHAEAQVLQDRADVAVALENFLLVRGEVRVDERYPRRAVGEADRDGALRRGRSGRCELDGAGLRGSDEAPRPGRVAYSYLVLPDAEDAGGHVRRLDARQGVGVAAVDEDDELDLAHRAVGDADVRDAQVLR